MEARGRQSTSLGAELESPFAMMRRMMEDMDSWFGTGRTSSTRGFTPALEVCEKDGKLLVRADLPGLKREDVRVHVDEDGLCIEGERKTEHEETRGGYFHSERSYGSFQRRIPLPRGADVSTCDASFDDGVLEVKSRGAGQPEQPKSVKH